VHVQEGERAYKLIGRSQATRHGRHQEKSSSSEVSLHLEYLLSTQVLSRAAIRDAVVTTSAKYR